MSNITIKKINDESFNSIALYLDYVLSITKDMGVPYFINMDGTKYFVTRVENGNGLLYACSYESDGKLKGFGMSVPNDNPELVSITDGVTIYRDYSRLQGNPFIIKENVVNDNKEQLAIIEDDNGEPSLIYYQEDLDRNMDCEIMYSLKGHENNISSYIQYLDVKYPKSVVIGEDTKLLKVINHRKTEKYRYSDSQYLIPLFNIFGIEFANSKSLIELDDVLYNVRCNGFHSQVPNQMKELLTNTNQVESNMKKLAKIYDESIMKI